jgi:hypothetical protein
MFLAVFKPHRGEPFATILRDEALVREAAADLIHKRAAIVSEQELAEDHGLEFDANTGELVIDQNEWSIAKCAEILSHGHHSCELLTPKQLAERLEAFRAFTGFDSEQFQGHMEPEATVEAIRTGLEHGMILVRSREEGDQFVDSTEFEFLKQNADQHAELVRALEALSNGVASISIGGGAEPHIQLSLVVADAEGGAL